MKPPLTWVRETWARIMPRVRTAGEFKANGKASTFVPPRDRQLGFCWDLASIRAAVDDQFRGQFARPVALAEAMKRDSAIFNAWRNRVAPVNAMRIDLVACDGARGEGVARRARVSCFAPRSVLLDISNTLVDHGIAIGFIEREPSEDGSRIDFRLTEWPLEFVKWDASRRTLLATVEDEAQQIPITHGDGQWIVFRKFYRKPWAKDACILPAALVYAAHGNAIRDWAQSSQAHGQARVVGELRDGVALLDETNVLSPEAQAFLDMMVSIVSGESGAAIRPAGSKTDFIANPSTAWQVFLELVTNREKAASRIYNGTDAQLGSVGGAPGVDISELFKVQTTLIQADVEALEQGLRSGLFEPWCATNEGDSRYAPSLKFRLPDPDGEQAAKQAQDKQDKLFARIDQYKKAGMTCDQPVVDGIAADLGILPEATPKLAKVTERAVAIGLAPTDVAKVVLVKEARAANGLPPFGDSRDNLTIAELEEASKAKAAGATAAPVGATPPAAPAP